MVGYKQWRRVGGWNGKERKSQNILMFEKSEEMNKIRYGGIRGGKLVIMRAKMIAWSRVMLCKSGGSEQLRTN